MDHNFVYGNDGPGEWVDINSQNIDMSYNVLINNVQPDTRYQLGNALGGGGICEVSNGCSITHNIMINNDTALCRESTQQQPFTCPPNGFNMGGVIIAESSRNTVTNNTITGYSGIGFAMNSSAFVCGQNGNCVGQGRVDWCGGATLSTYLNGAPYCPSRVDGTACDPQHPTGCIHDIRDQEDANCEDYSSSGMIHNCNHVNSNIVYECETASDFTNNNIHAEIAGLDTDMGPASGQLFTTFYFQDPVYTDNMYYADIGNVPNLFAGPCSRQGSCTTHPPLLYTFSQWQAQVDTNHPNYGKQDITSGSSINQSNPCADH
jgi:parallel beta-helix repeat protein